MSQTSVRTRVAGYNSGMRSLILLLCLLLSACLPQPERRAASAIEALSRPAGHTGFARALKPKALSFPADDGPHPEFQTEWWYFTGNLETADKRHFGYQLTFFRRALSPGADKNPADWATHQIYFAHFTVTDVTGQRFYPFERWGRQSIGLAGAQSEPFKVWLDGWSISGNPERLVKLKAQSGDIQLELELSPTKPAVLQGDRGLSQKSAGAGNASYYYSRPRMTSRGQLSIKHERFSVSGLSWLDREWSTSVLASNQNGWDWFSLQLDDGRELMLYQLRNTGGGIDDFSSGTLIARDGSSQRLTRQDFSIEPTGSWTSPESRVRYPSGWRVKVPSANLNLSLEPWLQNQELPLSFRYWEGAVKIAGTAPGQGYVELTGYE